MAHIYIDTNEKQQYCLDAGQTGEENNVINNNALETIRQFAQTGKSDRETADILESIGATILGVKPASLINIRSIECLKLCKNYFACSGSVAFVIVKGTEEKNQLFFYHKQCLQTVLSDTDTRCCLIRLGYPKQGSADQYVHILTQKMRSAEFPHEAGFFFGYPYKDVCGFMGAPIPYRKTMGWRMYGDTRLSEMIYNLYRNARGYVRAVLQAYQ